MDTASEESFIFWGHPRIDPICGIFIGCDVLLRQRNPHDFLFIWVVVINFSSPVHFTYSRSTFNVSRLLFIWNPFSMLWIISNDKIVWVSVSVFHESFSNNTSSFTSSTTFFVLNLRNDKFSHLKQPRHIFLLPIDSPQLQICSKHKWYLYRSTLEYGDLFRTS